MCVVPWLAYLQQCKSVQWKPFHIQSCTLFVYYTVQCFHITAKTLPCDRNRFFMHLSNTLSQCVYYPVQHFVYHTLQCLHSGLPAAVNCCSPSPGQSSLQTPHHDHDHDYHHRHHLRHNDHHFSVTAVTLDPFCEILWNLKIWGKFFLWNLENIVFT